MTNKYSQAATELLSRRVAGTKAARLDEQYRPDTVEDALQIQASMIDLHTDAVSGWKCLLPLAEDKFVVAPIFSGSVQQGDNCALFADKNVVRIEPEIAFVLGKDLPASTEGYSEEQINDAIGSCHMALELMQSRFSDESGAEFYERLADGLVNQGLFIGPEIDREKAFAASQIDITVTQGESVQTFAGKHPNTMPATPIYWLINHMTRRGVSFKTGEAIITGSYCGIVETGFEKKTTINYAGIGEYTVEFNEKK
ncbi:hydratase [Vibrio sp. 10N.286.49.B3]|uniref:fumarylacetoacetate hydrolase family protein n=1 Tax=Vibrio sp. 10N.286.49.B3 TaxID=1880855 RepID=UPI000C83FE1A|nr:fumarylacetoacetate hydrolase family protein [Vibrio sp. 10N.286.49.B3]PMH46685.1 hydratase [Vibrio sp. 10N.286.49.B3]